jgi:PAS domain S-box-containing protein
MMKPFQLLVRATMSTRELFASSAYRGNDPARVLFSCIDVHYSHLGSGHAQLSYAMTPGYAASHELWAMMRSGLEQAPSILGLRPARVTLHVASDGNAVCDIRHEEREHLLTYVASMLAARRFRSEAQRELAHAHESLRQRYEDLTRALREREKAESALAESQSRFADVFRLAPCVMLITRMADATVLDVNEMFVKVTGYPRDTVVGQQSSNFPWWREPHVREQVLRGLTVDGYVLNVEASFIDRDGGEHFALVSGQRVSIRGEACVVWQTLDITEQKRAQAQQRALEERLSQKAKLESVGMLAGGIAHDFNNLLVSVVGNAEAALPSIDPKSPVHRQLRAIVTAGERAAELTRELLDYAGTGNTQLHALELVALIEETCELSRAALAKNVMLRIEARDRELWVQGDPSQLRRMFLNLIKNAAESYEGKPGEVAISIAIERAMEGSDSGVIHVRDHGRGMDDETRAKIFDPFFTTKRSGTGLGLASTLGILARHEGRVHVESRSGMGTTFRIELPRTTKPLESAPKPAPMSDFQGRGTILLIDDEESVREVVRDILQALGFTVQTAESGEEGLSLFEASPDAFTLVMLDCTMPGLSGAETLARLRAIEPRLPVLLCSGYSQNDMARSLTDPDRTRFLAKPFRLGQLADTLQVLVEARRER